MIPDLKVEVETIRKTQMEANLEMENLGKRSGITDVSITNRIQEIEERFSGAEDFIENIDTTVKENAKCKKLLTQNMQEMQDSDLKSYLMMLVEDYKKDINKFLKEIHENTAKKVEVLKEDTQKFLKEL